MKHNPRKMKWTKASRKYRGKEMTMDSTFEFEKKRNTAVKYDRNLWIKTIQAMKRIASVRKVRKERFQKRRLAGIVKERQSSAQKELTKHAHTMATVKLPAIKKLTAKEKPTLATEKVAMSDE